MFGKSKQPQTLEEQKAEFIEYEGENLITIVYGYNGNLVWPFINAKLAEGWRMGFPFAWNGVRITLTKEART